MPAATPTEWWRDAVIYQVYVRSFADSNGDGIGDLAGIRNRLPYLAELGVDALWVTPFYTSPMADFGYDVADYRDVDPIFGTLDDARTLVKDAHDHGLKILVDIVPNHTSHRHEWFAAALRDGPGSVARDRYIFRDGRGLDGDLPPNDWESVFGGPAWTRVPYDLGGQWYLHLFAPEQPDLNWENPQVRAEFDDILRFWLDIGVDGFRIDVAHGMVKAAGFPDVGWSDQIRMLGTERLPYFDQDGVHEVHRAFRQVLDSYDDQRIGVAEAWAPTTERLAAYTRPGELHQAFNFHYLSAGWDAATLRDVITSTLDAASQVGAPATWVLSNHDVVRHVSRFGDGEVGIRRARAAALLTLALPGSSYLYQGEELGLDEVHDLPEEFLQDPQRGRDPEAGRDGCRVPLPWDGDQPPFGFTSGGSWLPLPERWSALTVERQAGDPDSMLSLYRAALRIRHSYPALGDGPFAWLSSVPTDYPVDLDVLTPQARQMPHDHGQNVKFNAEARWGPSSPDVLAFARSPRDGGSTLVCTANAGTDDATFERPGRLLLSSEPIHESADGRVVLPADTTAWWDAVVRPDK
jgi:alpha-glucosidase